MLHDSERRASPRFNVTRFGACTEILDWTGKRITRAKLLNVSTTGAGLCLQPGRDESENSSTLRMLAKDGLD